MVDVGGDDPVLSHHETVRQLTTELESHRKETERLQAGFIFGHPVSDPHFDNVTRREVYKQFNEFEKP